MFSAPALSRPTARSTGAKCSACASSATDGGAISARTLNSAWRKRARIARQLGRIAHRMARVEPLQDLGFERFDDQDVHATCASALATAAQALRATMIRRRSRGL